MRILFALTSAAALSACAMSGGPGNFQSEYERLTAECRQQGGVLVPIGGANTGDPATEYACNVRESPALNSSRN